MASRTNGRAAASRQDLYVRDILAQVEKNEAVSQRSIARELGIALGLANLLLRRMARNGLIRLVHVKPNRVLYFVTPAGIAEKARMTVDHLTRNVSAYCEARDRIRQSFAALSAHVAASDPGETAQRRIVFHGAGEIAEIGFVCLQDTDLELVGVVDESSEREKFFGLPVLPLESLSGLTIGGQPFDYLAAMSLADADAVLPALLKSGVPRDRIFCLI